MSVDVDSEVDEVIRFFEQSIKTPDDGLDMRFHSMIRQRRGERRSFGPLVINEAGRHIIRWVDDFDIDGYEVLEEDKSLFYRIHGFEQLDRSYDVYLNGRLAKAGLPDYTSAVFFMGRCIDNSGKLNRIETQRELERNFSSYALKMVDIYPATAAQ